MQISPRALERAKLHLIPKPGGLVLSGYLSELQKSYGLRGVDARVRSRVDQFPADLCVALAFDTFSRGFHGRESWDCLGRRVSRVGNLQECGVVRGACSSSAWQRQRKGSGALWQ